MLNAENVGYDTIEGMPQPQTGELASQTEVNQAKRKRVLSPCPFMWPKFGKGGGSSLPTSDKSDGESPSQVCPDAWPSIGPRCG